MMPTLGFFSAILAGLLGSLHCLGMCGGIATALAMQGNNRFPLRFLAYHAGRILTYCLLGALLGLGSNNLQETLPQLGPAFRLFAALMLILMGLYVSQWWLGLTAIENVGGKLWRKIQPLAGKALHQQNPFAMIATGMLWGFLPCGLVYSTLSLALASADPLHAAITMLGFGLGTLPLLLLSQFAGFGTRNAMSRLLKNKMPRTLAGLVLMTCGIWTGFAALQHSQHTTHNHSMPEHSEHSGADPSTPEHSTPHSHHHHEHMQ
jgi:sulfite exporter TauE/SafE